MDASAFGPQTVWAVIMLVLVTSSIIAARLKWSQLIRYILIWAGIFGVVYGVTLFRSEIGMVWERVRTDLFGGTPQSDGRTMVIPQSSDGHYWVNAQIGGATVRFLIDTGATTSVVSADEAARLGLVESGLYPVFIETANGTLRMTRTSAPQMTVGTITTRDVSLLVSPRSDGINVLGMSWLNLLAGWRSEGGSLILTPRAEAGRPEG